MGALEWTLSAWATLAAGFSVVAWVRLRPSATPREPARWPPVLLLRPMESPTATELAGLAAPIDYPAPVEQVVVGPEPLPLPPGVRFVRSEPGGGNRKVGHLLAALEACPPAGRAVLAVDGDVRVDGALVRALAAPLGAGAALTWAPPLPQEASGLEGRAARGLLGRTHHSFLALAAMPAGAPAVCGKAVGLSPEALAVLPQLAACIGEDLELSLRLSARGERVVEAAAGARLGPLGRGARARFVRWMQVLRAHRPALAPSVPLLLAPGPVLLPALLLAGLPAWALLFALARTLLAVRLGRRSGAGGASWEWLLGEALLLGSFLASLGRRTVAWRGRRFRLGRHGEMTAVPG